MDPKEKAFRSEGARMERDAVRSRLRRRIKRFRHLGLETRAEALEDELKWMLTRQLRYNKVCGGLGK